MLGHFETAELALKSLKSKGMDSALAVASRSRKEELNYNVGEISLLRTTTETSLALSAIRGGRKAQISANRATGEAVEQAATELSGLVEAGVADSAYGFAPAQPRKEFHHGPEAADFAKMRERMDEFLDTVRGRYPKVILEEGFLEFTASEATLLNSHGVDFRARHGRYGFLVLFSAKDGSRTSGFNYAHGRLRDLSRPLIECLHAEPLLREASGQLDRKSVPDKFTGDLLVTPHCLMDLLGAYLGYLSDGPLLNGTSVFRGKLGEKIASPLFSVRAHPQGPEFASHEFFDGDGFESHPMDIVDRGVLKHYLLSLYGANKLGLPRAKNGGTCLSVDAGTSSEQEMIRSMKKGIVIGRYSGGRPTPNGDFSGVAKNSYFVENGEIRYPVAETMVSGNLVELFRNVASVSKERVHFGVRSLPWMLASGVTVSGK